MKDKKNTKKLNLNEIKCKRVIPIRDTYQRCMTFESPMAIAKIRVK